MRRYFASLLHRAMSDNKDIYLITGDLGYGLWDSIRDDYKYRFFNVGSSEMAMLGVGVGLAMEGKIPFVYSITPFAIYRPFEMIRNYMNHESVPVIVVGGGRDRDYGHLGFSHWAEDDQSFMSEFNNIKSFRPNSECEIDEAFEEIMSVRVPYYVNLKK